MTTEIKSPLWKVLNEQRQQVTFYHGHGSFIITSNGVEPICQFYSVLGQADNSKRVANAQYTALAVNNLHHLAEALEKIKELSSEWDSKTHNQITEMCAKALNRIS